MVLIFHVLIVPCAYRSCSYHSVCSTFRAHRSLCSSFTNPHENYFIIKTVRKTNIQWFFKIRYCLSYLLQIPIWLNHHKFSICNNRYWLSCCKKDHVIIVFIDITVSIDGLHGNVEGISQILVLCVCHWCSIKIMHWLWNNVFIV